MHTTLVAVSLLALFSAASAQCTGNDNSACASWKANGYCTNPDAPMADKKKYCGVTCGLCNTDGTQTAAGGGTSMDDCTDANANCASWVITQDFCARTDYSNSMKLMYCCATCYPVLFPSTTTTPP